MNFKIDENLPIELAQLLKRSGHDALTVFDEKIQGATDKTLFEICTKENRILITLDLDFADIINYPPLKSNEIIVLRITKQDKVTILSIFNKIIPFFAKEPLEHKLWIVEESRIRVHGE